MLKWLKKILNALSNTILCKKPKLIPAGKEKLPEITAKEMLNIILCKKPKPVPTDIGEMLGITDKELIEKIKKVFFEAGYKEEDIRDIIASFRFLIINSGPNFPDEKLFKAITAIHEREKREYKGTSSSPIS